VLSGFLHQIIFFLEKITFNFFYKGNITKLSVFQKILIVFIFRNLLNNKLSKFKGDVSRFNRNFFNNWRVWNINKHKTKGKFHLGGLKIFNKLCDVFSKNTAKKIFTLIKFFEKNFFSNLA